MLRILVAVDGSASSMHAVRHLAKLLQGQPESEVHILNVQVPLPGAASRFLSRKDVKAFHSDEGDRALKEARRLLDEAGVQYEPHVAVGQIAPTIVDYAEERRCDQILMGTRGLGPVENLLLGSVAMKVLHLTKLPVTLVK